MSFFTTTTSNASSAFSLFAQPQDPREAYENSRSLWSLVDPASVSRAPSNAYPNASPTVRLNEDAHASTRSCTCDCDTTVGSRTKSNTLLGGFRRVIFMGGKSSSEPKSAYA